MILGGIKTQLAAEERATKKLYGVNKSYGNKFFIFLQCCRSNPGLCICLASVLPLSHTTSSRDKFLYPVIKSFSLSQPNSSFL
jgi:hypothetical protein